MRDRKGEDKKGNRDNFVHGISVCTTPPGSVLLVPTPCMLVVGGQLEFLEKTKSIWVLLDPKKGQFCSFLSIKSHFYAPMPINAPKSHAWLLNYEKSNYQSMV